MVYKKIKNGRFIKRVNRFIAEIEIDGKTEVCHVKNTGRCHELFIEGAEVFVEESDNKNRKTKYDLIAVYKNGRLINIDSMAPNKVFGEYVKNGRFIENITLVRPEKTYLNSRFDFYIEADGARKIFVEVKGVTLEENGVVMFPDAPTERGLKHVNELIKCVEDGYEAYVAFVIQMKGVKYFTPNIKTHSKFAEALKKAELAGVKILCFDCLVELNRLEINNPVKVKL